MSHVLYGSRHTYSTHCNALQRTATHCNALQHTTNTLYHTATSMSHSTCSVHCNTLQHTAAHCNTFYHAATRCNTLHHIHVTLYTPILTATHCNTQQHTATHCITLQHTATHCNIHVTLDMLYALQHTFEQRPQTFLAVTRSRSWVLLT